MRKIEQDMWNAINGMYDADLGNTAVVHTGNQADIYLHGYPIAAINTTTGELVVNTNTLDNWPTNTTKSRLRALGADVTTKKGITYLDGVEVC